MSEQDGSQKRQWLSEKTKLVVSTAGGSLAFMAIFIHLLMEDEESSWWIFTAFMVFWLSRLFWHVWKVGTEASVEVVVMFAILFCWILMLLYF